MLIAVALAVIYMGGAAGTMITRMEDNIDFEVQRWAAGHETPGWMMTLVSLWTVTIGLLWPVYWTGRLLYAVPEHLALNPGEPQ